MSRQKTEKPEEERALQYQWKGGALVRCGTTVKRMQSGFYDVVDTGYGNWGLQKKSIVSDELIDMPGTIADVVFKDIDAFLSTKDEYVKFQLTHKRGYLMYGPPGSGKTSMALLLAKRFVEQADGIVMFCPGPNEFYHGTSIMRDVEPGRPTMYLLEEADHFVNHTVCLSILDGELSIQGAVFVAMTNYKEKLPPRICNRPGRFDQVTYVGCPPEEVQHEYLRRVAARGDAPASVVTDIVTMLRGMPVSMAHLREAFVAHYLMKAPLSEVQARFDGMMGITRDVNGNISQFVITGEDDDDSCKDSYIEDMDEE